MWRRGARERKTGGTLKVKNKSATLIAFFKWTGKSVTFGQKPFPRPRPVVIVGSVSHLGGGARDVYTRCTVCMSCVYCVLRGLPACAAYAIEMFRAQAVTRHTSTFRNSLSEHIHRSQYIFSTAGECGLQGPFSAVYK